MPYYVVNAGRGRFTHIIKSNSPSTPNPMSPGSIAAQLIWFGGNAKSTLCGLQATRYVNVFTPAEASCRECKKRWELGVKAEAAQAAKTPEQKQAEARQMAIGCLIVALFFAVIAIAIIVALHYSQQKGFQLACHAVPCSIGRPS